MYRLIDFECENFIGIYNGLGRKKLQISFKEYKDKRVFIILGHNAKGKSTLLSILHPFSSTTDKRDKFIRENKEGYKQLIYERQDGDDQIRIRHVYIPNGKDGHRTRSFIHKVVDGKEIDLNPNGNVSSFHIAVEREFGVTEDFMRLSAQNEDMISLVRMTGANRKDHIYNFIPKADDTTVYQKIVGKKYRDVKVFLSSLVDKLGKMEDEIVIKERLEDIEVRTNELVTRRDRGIGKLNKYEAEIKTLDPSEKLTERYRHIRSELKDLNEKQEKLQSKIQRLIGDTDKPASITEVDKELSELVIKRASLREKIVGLSSTLIARRETKSRLYDSIEEKESLVRQLSGSKSKSDLSDLLEEYKDRLVKFDKRIKTLNTSLQADDLIRGIDIISHLRDFMTDIHNASENHNTIEEACIYAFSNKFEAEYAETAKTLETIKEKINGLNTNIASLNGYEYLKDTLDKRPKDCVIDSCSFLQDYHKWIAIEKEIDNLQEKLVDLSKTYKSLLIRMEKLTEIHKLKMKIETMITFYKSNLSLISKLPFNDRYDTVEKLLNRLIERDMLKGVENNFYELIEILQDKKEFDEIRSVKIPLLMNELKGLQDNDGVVNTLKTEISKLEKAYENEVSTIQKEDALLESLEDELELISSRETLVIELKERLNSSEQNKTEIIRLSNEFDSVKGTSERIEELHAKIEERRQKLKVVEAKLRPLTQERDHYKHQEMKIKEYKTEKEILEENLNLLSIIRDALSTNKGIPVSILNMYVDEIRQSANTLLSETFDGQLYLHKFLINEKEFTIPYQHNGEISDDISRASSSERSFISTCLSMAIIEQIISAYGILNLDEVDAAMSNSNKMIYCHILMKQARRIGINQIYIITHSYEFYEAYQDSIAYILFPGHELNEKGKDCIKVY